MKSYFCNLREIKFKPTKYLIILLEILVLIFSLYNLSFTNKIFPNVYVAGIDLGGKTINEATNILSAKIKIPDKITLIAENQSFDITKDSINLSADFEKSAKAALDVHRTGNLLLDFYNRFSTLFSKTTLGLRVYKDDNKLEKNIFIIAGQVGTDPVYPTIKLVSNEVIVNKGKPGVNINTNLLKATVGQAFSYANGSSIQIPLEGNYPALNDHEADLYKKRAEKLLDKNITLKYDLNSYFYSNEKLFELLNPRGEYNDNKLSSIVGLISNDINRSTQNSTFAFKEGRVEEFTPAKDGVKVKEEALKNMLIGNLRTLESSDEKTITLEIPVELTSPKIKTEDVNNLGIKELLGRGVSYFRGSIAGRIYNIGLASSKFKGVLIPPGETISFNKTVGDVSDLTGYKQAYIIKDGKTVLGDGGGVCQVSTTLFRAALDTGLPIVERKAHSYRVSYYEQGSPVGIDATVYDPTADLKFTNNTPFHLLIQPQFDAKKYMLVFEIYGTNDGRKSEVSKPAVSGLTPPPDDLYVDDSTLPAGKIKQIDWKAWGSKVSFNYKVTRKGEVIFSKTFISNYRPWQAVYLRGTGPSQ